MVSERKNFTELCSNVLWKVELVGDELGYFVEEISMKEEHSVQIREDGRRCGIMRACLRFQKSKLPLETSAGNQERSVQFNCYPLH